MITALLVALLTWMAALTGGLSVDVAPVAHPRSTPPAATVVHAGPVPASRGQQPSTPTLEAPTDVDEPATDSPMCAPDLPELVPAPPACWDDPGEAWPKLPARR